MDVEDLSLIINLHHHFRLQHNLHLHLHLCLRLQLCLQMHNQSTCRCPAFVFASSTAFIFTSSCAFRYTYLIISLAGSHPPIVDHPDGGPSKTNGRRLIALIYSDGRPMKFEPQDVTRSVTKALLQYLPGPIAQWKEYPREEKEKGGPVSYKELFEHTHRKKNTGDFISQKAKEVMETYAEQMVDRHGGDSTQYPEFDVMAWLAATGQPKKGRVFGFGSSLDAGRVISSSQDSHGSTIATTPPHSSILPSDQVREVPPIRDLTIEAHQVERAERDDAEDPRIQDD
ncbi:hypothetical protein Taro_039107 [Colocasia esculenta]|uniref:Uncharacterized protein n=1 Tax=Colocasia esculenta TaxID=4460 RepID=A0A843WQL7_COLES|nr:hypothetical protein [Colocasia esculenta]